MAHNVIGVLEITPEEISTRARETKAGWQVECEDGCGTAFIVRRTKWKPTDYTKGVNDATPVIEVRLTQPPLKRCGCRR